MPLIPLYGPEPTQTLAGSGDRWEPGSNKDTDRNVRKEERVEVKVLYDARERKERDEMTDEREES